MYILIEKETNKAVIYKTKKGVADKLQVNVMTVSRWFELAVCKNYKNYLIYYTDELIKSNHKGSKLFKS